MGLVSLRTSISSGMARLTSFAPVKMAANVIGSVSVMRAAAITGFAGATVLSAFGCGRMLDAFGESTPDMADSSFGGTAGTAGSAGMGGTAGTAGFGGSAGDSGTGGTGGIGGGGTGGIAGSSGTGGIGGFSGDAGLDADADVNPVDVIEAGDADGAVCTPLNFPYNNFNGTTGAYSNTVASGGTIVLATDNSVWGNKYEGDVLPETVGWSRNGNFVGGACTIQNPDAGSQAYLECSTLGLTTVGNYQKTIGASNAKGLRLEMKLKLPTIEGTPPDTTGFALVVADGSRSVEFKFFPNDVCENQNTGMCNNSDPVITSVDHIYGLSMKGNDFVFTIDGKISINGTGMLLTPAGGSNAIVFGSRLSNVHSTFDLDYLYYDTNSDKPPYFATGNYIHNSKSDSTVDNFDWTGVFAGWTNNGGGTASLAIRTGNTPADLSAASFSSEFTVPGAIPTGFLGKLLEWRLTENSNPDTPIVPEVSFKKDCPDQ